MVKHEIAELDRQLRNLRSELRTLDANLTQSRLLRARSENDAEQIQNALEAMRPTDNSKIAAYENLIGVRLSGGVTHLRKRQKRNGLHWLRLRSLEGIKTTLSRNIRSL
jgi:chromosome segregation ATPase